MSCAVAIAVGILFAVKLRFYGVRAAAAPLAAGLIFAAACACFTLGNEAAEYPAKRWRVRLARFFAVCVGFFAGAGDFYLYAARYESAADVSGITYVTALVEESRETDKGVWYVLKNVSFDGRAAEGKLALYMYAAGSKKIADEGSMVAFNAEISANTAWTDEENGRENRAYEWRRDLRYEAAACKNFRVIGNAAGLFTRIRLRLKEALKKSASPEAYALGTAVLTGDTAEMDGELLDSFRYGGVAHIFAVSGLHVGALFAFLLAIFSKRRALPGAAKWLIAAGVLAFYGGICGFSASVARAIVMCLAFYADKLFGGKRDSAESMGKAAALVQAVSPAAIFDAGFLLSFGAVAGILSLSPVISRLLSAWIPARGRGRKALRGAVAAVSVSLGATAVTLPVMCRCFGYVSGVSLLLNVFIVPLVSAAFPVFLALAAVAAAVPPLAGAALYLPSLALSGLSTLFYAADFSAFAIEFPFTAVSLVGYYGACLCAGDKVNLRYRVRVAGIFAGLFVCSAGFFL